MGAPGEDLLLSPLARKLIPLSLECKNQEALNIWSAHNQAESNSKPGAYPAVVYKRNFSNTYISMRLDNFIELLKERAEKLEI
jgi:hypothetical protein